MEYLNDDNGFVNEFFERTLKIIEQYEHFDLSSDSKYEATLLCNCLLGILVFPEQKYYKTIDNSFLSKETWDKLIASMRSMGTQCKKDKNNVQYIFRRMRNAVSHQHIKFSKSNIKSDNTIKSICFYDDEDYKNKQIQDYDFIMEIEICVLKDILIEFCTNAIKKNGSEKV